jgi:hypothetical protein
MFKKSGSLGESKALVASEVASSDFIPMAVHMSPSVIKLARHSV